MIKEFDKYKIWGPYHWLWGTRKNHWYNKMVKLNLKEFTEKGSILDVGCGDGYVCAILKDRGFDVEGFDSDPYAINFARTLLPNIKIQLASINDVELDKSFDYFICQNAIEHFKDPVYLVALFEKYCNKYMVLVTDTPGKIGKFEYNSFSFDDICQLFNKFKVEKLYEFRKCYGVKISK